VLTQELTENIIIIIIIKHTILFIVKEIKILSDLRKAIPLCVQNRYRKIRQTQQQVIYYYTRQLLSTHLWGHRQASD
jgi:hypothetical protein